MSVDAPKLLTHGSVRIGAREGQEEGSPCGRVVEEQVINNKIRDTRSSTANRFTSDPDRSQLLFMSTSHLDKALLLRRLRYVPRGS